MCVCIQKISNSENGRGKAFPFKQSFRTVCFVNEIGKRSCLCRADQTGIRDSRSVRFWRITWHAKYTRGKVYTNSKTATATDFLYRFLLEQLANGPNSTCANTLNLFAYGTYKQYAADKSKYLELTPGQKKKLQHLTIVTLATRSKVRKINFCIITVKIHFNFIVHPICNIARRIGDKKCSRPWRFDYWSGLRWHNSWKVRSKE